MCKIFDLEKKIKEVIDDLKGLCSSYGLSNQASEEVIITNVFLYKFLNDKFMFNIKKFSIEMGLDYKEVLNNTDGMLDAFRDVNSMEVQFSYEDTIEYLIQHLNDADFYKQFDDTLVRISSYEENQIYAIETSEGTKNGLFENITNAVENKNNFVQSIFNIIASERFDFSDAFNGNFDFYSTIFEYLIKDYNVASGVYAEYFTPQAVSNIIAQILVKMSPVEDTYYEIYDPSAGSGSLVLHLANALGCRENGEKKARVYTQDISNKSTRFLRLNMILNDMRDSLDNIVQGDTLLNPYHFAEKHVAISGLKQFDYITSNPPFKTDFSTTRDSIESKWKETDRFFAGLPKIPNKKKDSMAIYTTFMQHILYSLKDTGKAAIVVPTGFITAQSSIELKIRQKLIDNNWLKGVISMPSNIFANTGTNVSVILIDKSNSDDKVLLMDASNLGEKVKDGKNQKTVLSGEEVEKIINTFVNKEVIEDFSVKVTNKEIKEKNYSFSAGQYFEVKIDYVDISQEEYNTMISDFNRDFAIYVAETLAFQASIKEQLEGLSVNEEN